MAILIRLFLTLVLLIIVWNHAQWSLALSLFCLFAASEMQAWASRLAARRLDESPVIQRYLREREERSRRKQSAAEA